MACNAPKVHGCTPDCAGSCAGARCKGWCGAALITWLSSHEGLAPQPPAEEGRCTKHTHTEHAHSVSPMVHHHDVSSLRWTWLSTVRGLLRAEDGQLNRGRQRHALHPTWPPGQSTLLYPAGRQTGLEDAEGAAGCLDVRSGCCFSVSSKVWLVYCCLQPVPAPTLQDMGLCHHGTTPVKIGVWHAPSIHMQFGYMSQGLTSMWATEVLL